MIRDVAATTGFFLSSFLVTGLTVSVTPSRAGGDVAWLGAVLLLGTVASMVGVSVADRVRAPAWAWPAATTGVAIAAFVVPNAVAHAGLHVLARGLANATTQDLDRRVALGPRDWLATLARTAGMTAGPLWFGFVREDTPFTAIIVATVGLVATLAAPRRRAPDAPVVHRLGRGEVPLWAGAIATWAALHVLASGAIALLADRADAGLAVGLVFASAALATPVLAARDRSPGLATALVAPAAATAAATTLAFGVTTRGAVLPGAVGVGVAFAAYLLAIRAHALRERDAGRPGWITAFNQLGNASALVGFASLGAAGWVAAPSASVPAVAGLLALGAGIGIGRASWSAQRENPRWTNVVPHPSS